LANPLRKKAKERYGKGPNDRSRGAAGKAKFPRTVGANYTKVAHTTSGAFAIAIVEKRALIRDVSQGCRECHRQHGKADIRGSSNRDPPNEE
jgi:hypothetical protein